jgi:hypothetical protein
MRKLKKNPANQKQEFPMGAMVVFHHRSLS